MAIRTWWSRPSVSLAFCAAVGLAAACGGDDEGDDDDGGGAKGGSAGTAGRGGAGGSAGAGRGGTSGTGGTSAGTGGTSGGATGGSGGATAGTAGSATAGTAGNGGIAGSAGATAGSAGSATAGMGGTLPIGGEGGQAGDTGEGGAAGGGEDGGQGGEATGGIGGKGGAAGGGAGGIGGKGGAAGGGAGGKGGAAGGGAGGKGGGGNLPNLYFSEYVANQDNANSPDAVEIYNAGSAPVSLSACDVLVYWNGSDEPGGVIPLDNVTLADGDTYVVCRSAIGSLCTQIDSDLNFTGDDVIALDCGTGENPEFVDVFGEIGEDPGSNWGDGSPPTSQITLRRNCAVTIGDRDPSNTFNPDAQWAAPGGIVTTDLGNRDCP